MIDTLPVPRYRELHLIGDLDEVTVKATNASILDINASDKLLKKLYKVYGLEYTPKPINLYIDSYGGNVEQALGVISCIESSAVPVNTYVTGTAKSAGFMILISGHQRFAGRFSSIMYHQLSGFTFGNIPDMELSVEESKRLQVLMEEIILEKTAIGKEKLKKIYSKKKDWYMSPQQALELGVVDAIV